VSLTSSRFLQLAPTDHGGLRATADLPWPLPYHLEPRDVLRLVEDVHQLLHDLNNQLSSKGYEPLEELLDKAGFSGLISRAVVDRVARLSKGLDRNEFHNGYPDLLPHGAYPQNRVQHGVEGGLEVKASRSEGGWQSHGPRGGWFCVVQFALDEDESKALWDREPTRVRAVLVAELSTADWSWQPAREGRIRSGTASVKPSGEARLRSGAVWVDPAYEPRHLERLAEAGLKVLRADAPHRILAVFEHDFPGQEVTRNQLAEGLAARAGLGNPARLASLVETAVRELVRSGAVRRVSPGRYRRS
jgi:hypothetical protein